MGLGGAIAGNLPVPNLLRGKRITNQHHASENCHRLYIHDIIYVMVGPNTIDGQDAKGYSEEKAENDANGLGGNMRREIQAPKDVTYIELVKLGQPNNSVRINAFLPLRSV
jgi:hypothetical protein